jgi:hypothetical protein
VREGDLDHLIFYILQSKRFTSLPAIEPAVSAKALVDGLPARDRAKFLDDPRIASAQIAQPVRDRIDAFLRAIRATPANDARLAYFRTLTTTVFANAGTRAASLSAEYLRVMRFVYEKEFVAQRSERPTDAIARLYRTRGLSTDTAVEAGFLVYEGLGIARSLGPPRRIRRVLIVGPGLDLAPRTAMLDERPAESYQPWAVIDALIGLNLASADDLAVVAADINPRVVEHLRRARATPPELTLITETRDTDSVAITADYRAYFSQLGRSIGDADDRGAGKGTGGLRKRVRVRPAVAGILDAVALDIVTQRLDGQAFDVVIATNILPYFDDRQLMLAMANIAAMTAPGGVFLHNEPRPVLGEIAGALGLPFEQSRHVTIATVRGASAPLFDSVFLHRREAR